MSRPNETRKCGVKRGTLRVRAYPVLAECIERGVAWGFQRAHKHTDTPSAEDLRAQIEQAVLNEICEAFDFPEDDQR